MHRPEAVDEEVVFDGRQMITETDLKGKITYVNRKFVEMSGYTREELLGKSHNLIRHPDMPKCAFNNMWEHLNRGEEWSGFVKNLRKDGKYYWVKVIVAIKKDEAGTAVGYIATRQPISEKDKEQFGDLYRKLVKENCPTSPEISNYYDTLLK